MTNSVRSQAPSSGLFRCIDVYMLCCNLFVFAALGEAALVGMTAPSEKHANEKEKDEENDEKEKNNNNNKKRNAQKVTIFCVHSSGPVEAGRLGRLARRLFEQIRLFSPNPSKFYLILSIQPLHFYSCSVGPVILC